MKLAARIVTTLALVAVLLFCIFGFLATREPMPLSTQITWRLVYGSLGVIVILGIAFINRRQAS